MDDAAAYARARALFQDALDQEPAARAAFVRGRAGADHALAAEVLSLLSRVAEGEPSESTNPGARLRRKMDALASEAASGDAAAPGAPMPQRIGNCVVIRCLGEGGMGVVYEAEQQNPHRRVAVKLMRADFGASGLASRFRREAELLGRLEHPGIARVYEAGHARAWGPSGPEVPYLVMELVDGLPLTAYATRHALSVEDRLRLLARICDAVQHAHERGVVHRDLKPANVLVDGAGQPRVLDFGVGRALDADPHAGTLHTGTSQLVGTLPYMSPEQLSGTSAVGTVSDVYALGVLAHELLTGRRPLLLAGLSLADAIRQVQEVEPAPPSSVDPRLAGDVDAIVAKALEKEPSRRYQSAAEMAADIERHLADEPIVARPQSSIYRATKFVRRNRAIVSATASLVVVLVAGIVATAWLALREARAKRTAEVAVEDALWSAHRADLGAALAALDVSDERTARRTLQRTPAAFRDWTWRHVASRTDDAISVLKLDGVSPESPVQRLTVRADGALVLATSRGLVVVATSGDRLRFERRLAGDWPAVSPDGMRALERRAGRWIDHPTDRPGGEIDLGAAGSEGAIGLPSGGWLVSAPEGARVHAADGAVELRSDEAAGRPLVAVPGRRWAACNRGETLVALPLRGEGAAVQLGRNALAADATPDGRLLVVGRRDGSVETWDVSGAAPRRIGSTPLTTLAIEWLAVAGRGDRFVAVDRRGLLATWSLGDAHAGRLATIGYSRRGLAVSPEGDVVLASTSSGAVLAVGLDGERAGSPRLGSAAAVTAVAFLPGRRRVASADVAGELRLFAEPGVVEPRRLAGHESYVYDVGLSADGGRIASIAWDGTLRAWDARTGEATGTFALPALVGLTLAWLPGDRVAATAEKQITVFDVRTGQVVARRILERGPRGLAWDAARSELLSLDEQGELSAWRPDTGEERTIFTPPVLAGVRGALAISGERAYVSRENRLLAVSTADGTPAWDVTAPCEMIGDLDVAAGVLAAACLDAAVVVLDAATGRVERRLTVPGGAPMHAVALHPKAELLASGSQDGLVCTWDLARGELLAQLRGHQDYVHGLAFSPDGTMLVSGSGDATVRTWDTLPLGERFRRERGAGGVAASAAR